MNSDATEAALGLLRLSPHNITAPVSPPKIIPLKRKQSTSLRPPSPPLPPPLRTRTPPTPAASTSFNPDAINCICGIQYDDGFSIACDDCSRWCHAACFDIVEGGVPEEWRCWVCVPRGVDRERAVRAQKARTKEVLGGGKGRRGSTAANGGEGKRKRRTSIIAEVNDTHDDHHHPQAAATAADDGDGEDEPWTQAYIPITHDIIPLPQTRDKLRRQAQHWRGITALAPPTHTTPHTTIHPLPAPPTSILPPSYTLHTTHPVPAAALIAPYTSTITPSATYLADPLNAYAHLSMPKPFVHLLGHPLDLSLDARLAGGDARWARSGCRPNAVLRPVLCTDAGQEEGETLSFGVFALRDLSAHEEVVLGWEWDDGSAVHSLPALIQNPHSFPPPHRTYLRHQFASLLHALSSTFTSCACGARARDCALRRMAEFVEREDGEGDASLVGEGEEKGKGDGAEGEGGGEVDLGPLVGAPRGFRTRERVPFGGGMGGVEMDVDTALPAPPRLPQSQSQSQFQLPPAPSPPTGLDPLPQQMNHTHEGDVDIDIDVEGDWEGDAHPRIDKGKQPVRVHDVACAFRESNLPPVPHPHVPQTQTPTLVLTTPSPDARKRQRIGEKEGSGSGRGNHVTWEDMYEATDGEEGGGGVHEEEDQILSWEDHYLADDDGTRGPVQSHQSLHSSLPQSPTPTAGPDAEDKMPPKMRKRWIHQSAQALRATAGVEEDGGGVLGKMDVDVEGNGEGDGDVELSDPAPAPTPALKPTPANRSRRSSRSTSRGPKSQSRSPRTPTPTTLTPTPTPTPTPAPTPMAPPPMPASLDPTTVLSTRPTIPALNHTHPARTTSPLDHPSQSPSTSFAKLSLLSPVVPTSFTFAPSHTPSNSNTNCISLNQSPSAHMHTTLAVPRHNTASPSPLSQLHAQDSEQGRPASLSCLKGLWTEEQRSSSSSPRIGLFAQDQQQRHSGSPQPLASLPALERRRSPAAAEDVSADAEGEGEHNPRGDAEHEHDKQHNPSRPNGDASSSSPSVPLTDPRPLPHLSTPTLEKPPTPAPSPPPPPTPKVKMSLKDFALRKKKQREEMAKAAVESASGSGGAAAPVSPGSMTSALEGAAVGPGAGTEASVSPRINGVNLEGGGHRNGNEINGGPRLEPMTVDPQDKPAADVTRHGGLPLPNGMIDGGDDQVMRSPAQLQHYHSPPQDKATRSCTAPVAMSLKAKTELIDELMPPDTAATAAVPEHPRGTKGSQSEPPPTPVNGTAQNGDTDHHTPTGAASPSIHRPSQEDGEIRSISPPKQPSSFVPRAHTPPTQPRSFSLASPGSASTSAAPSSLPRRPSQSSLARPLPAGPSSSRPLPSGPRALRTSNILGSASAFPIARPLAGGSQFIPRGPSADRERIDWDRDRNWPGRARGRGAGWGR